MITLNLNDLNLIKNLNAIKVLRDSGKFTDAELQKLYDEQVEIDQQRKEDEKNDD